MINHKLLDILKNLSPRELKNFKDFVNSPFFNKSEKVSKLFERLIRNYPDFSFDGITKETLHYELFPNIKYNDATIRHLFSDLYNLAERFLIEVNIQTKDSEKSSYLLEELYFRNLPDLMETHLNRMEEIDRENKQLGSTVFLDRFKYQTDKFNYFSSKPDSFSHKNIDNIIQILNSRNKNLVVFFITELIKCADNINLIMQKYNFAPSANFTGDLINIIDIEKVLMHLTAHPELSKYSYIINTYYKLFRVFNNSDSDVFYFELKKEIKENIGRYSFEEISYLYKKLVDYCIKKCKTSNNGKDFSTELFSVYEDILIMKLFLNRHTNNFPLDLFRNILILALRIKNFEWAEHFIYFYSDYLPSGQKINIVNFSMASLFFEKAEFEKSLYYLNKLKLNNVSLKLDTKSLLLRIYFEINCQESLFSLSAAYKEFLKKSEGISDSKRKSHKEFIKFTEKLLMLKPTAEEMGLNWLKIEIEAANPLLNKSWLIEKINSLINNIAQRSNYYKIV